MQFVDTVEIEIAAGKGGEGCLSFRREKFVPQGGPDGGDGGRGGDVVLKATTRMNTLAEFRHKRKFKADNGDSGGSRDKTGRSAESLVIHVPVGTTVIDAESGEQLADLTEDEQSYTAARGGRGGRGNASFKTATNRAPRKVQPGEEGGKRRITLDLKLLADVGLVGLPNAGKSTLIARISAARPKIADYPFTTLTPNLGVVSTDDFRGFVVADIPGLIEGASAGAGLGHDFLRHVQRTRVLLHMVDCTALAELEPVEAFKTVEKELLAFEESLGEKPLVVGASKIDAAEDELVEQLRGYAAEHELPFFAFSAVSGEGIAPLIEHLLVLVDQSQALDVSSAEDDREAGP